MPITLGGVLQFNIENAMAACAGLVGLGMDYCMITKGFKTFKLNQDHNSGRFNVYDLDGVKIILDYGHNIEGYKAIFSAINKMKNNKVIGVIGMPGDRRDETVVSIGELCSQYLDIILIKEDKDRRGRRKGEMAKLLESGVRKGVNNKSYRVRLDEIDALKEAINISNTGDIIIVFYEELQPLIDIIMNRQCIHNSKVNIATV